MDGGTLVGLWVAAGVLGAIIALARGRLRFGAATWVFFGWWGLFFIAFFGGGILLWWSLMPSGMTRCPHCREQIRKDATVCPHCRSSLAVAASALQDSGVDKNKLLKEVDRLRLDGKIDEAEANDRRKQILA